MKIETNILEASRGEFKNDQGDNVKYSSAIILMGGREIKVNSDISLKDYIGKECTVTLKMTLKMHAVRYTIVDVQE